LNTSVPLVPPKPKLFFTRHVDLHVTRGVGAVVRSHSGSWLKMLMVGGEIWLCTPAP
jgi:hypothetical protein